MFLNKEIQEVMYFNPDKDLIDLVNIASRVVSCKQGLLDKAPEKVQITMFDIKSNKPLAAVDIVVKDFDEDDIVFAAWDYHFQTKFDFDDKKKVSVSVLTTLGYASLDDSSIKSDINCFKKTKGNEGKDPGDTLEEVIRSCQNLYKIKNRFAFYEKLEKEKSDDKNLMEKIYKVYGSYGALLNEINKKTHIINIIHEKAFDFDYSLGESLGSRSLLTHVEWGKILGKDFTVYDIDSGDNSFFCVVSNAINGNLMVRERFLSTANKLLCRQADAEIEHVTPALVRSVTNNWINEAVCVLLHAKYSKCEVSKLLDLSYESIEYLISRESDRLLDHDKNVISFFGGSVSLFSLVLSTGIPFVVFSTENDGSNVTASLFNPENAWSKWPDLMKVFENSENLIAAENTMVKDVIFISHSGVNKYYLCMKTFDKAKRIDPLLIAEEILLNKTIFPFGSFKNELSRELVGGSNVMSVIDDCFPWNRKVTEENRHDVYMELVKKSIGICFDGNHEIVGSTQESKEYSAEESIGSKPISIVNKEDSDSLDVNISNIFEKMLLDEEEVIDGIEIPVTVTKDLSLGVESLGDIVELGARLAGKDTGGKHKRKYAVNIEEIKKVMTVVFDSVSEQYKQDQCVVDQKIVVNLNKCCSVMQELRDADNLGCPLAPLILGMYQMIHPGNEYLGVNDLVGIIWCFTTAALRGNIQAPACLYWLAKITGSPEAFSLSISLSAILNQYFSDKILTLNFVVTKNESDHIVKECNKLWLPLFLGRWSLQRRDLDAAKLLGEIYPGHSKLGEDSSEWQVDQHISVVDRVSYTAHLAFFYLRRGDKERAMLEFRKAAFAYVWLVQKTDDMSVISRITKAAGVVSMYYVITCNDEGSEKDYLEFGNMRLCLDKSSSDYDFLWTLKSIGSDEEISTITDLVSKVSYFVLRKNEGMVFKTIDDLEQELSMRRYFLDFELFKCCKYIVRNRLELDMSDIGAARSTEHNEVTKPVNLVGKVKNGKGVNRAVNRTKACTGLNNVRSGLVSNKEKRSIISSIESVADHASEVLGSFPDDQFCYSVYNKKCPEVREKSIIMAKECIDLFEKIDIVKDCASKQKIKKMRAGVYDRIWIFLKVLYRCDSGIDFDDSLAKSILKLSLSVFGNCEGDLNNVSDIMIADYLSVKLCCLFLLNPGNYNNMDKNMQVKMVTRLFVCLSDFALELGISMKKLDVGKQRLYSFEMMMLLDNIEDIVDDRNFYLLMIDIICKVVIVDVDEDVLSSALLGYFTKVENEVDCAQRENDYLVVQKHLEHAHNKGIISSEFHTKWKSLVVSPYTDVREKDEKQKEEAANLIAADLIQEEEMEKDEREWKQKCKQEVISCILKRKIRSVSNDGKEHLGAFFPSKDLSTSLQTLNLEGGESYEDENNKKLVFLYEKMLTSEFGVAFEGFCECEREERRQLGSADSLYLAIINMLQFECLVERVKYECPTFLCLSKQSKLIKKYLDEFVKAEKCSKLPSSVSAEQLKASYTEIAPLIVILREKECKINKAIDYAKNAVSILTGFDKNGQDELELLLLQTSQLSERILEAGEIYQNLASILNIRRNVLKNIRSKDTGGSAETRVDIKASDLFKSCNRAIKCVEELKDKLSEFDKINTSKGEIKSS
ncbi:MAG: hypothetical protein QS748_01205 [Candidatus Endonucleobacter bathymodioli]|uniref:Uncharacterized protein n=1 Tax=Candidatus Endonucleibacter bathymodioli TaxID=539814 RepID=A0AA90NW04_9GAMM|nr:hypothetical protein [Candidatus Endonucleobacter bathymodioli]